MERHRSPGVVGCSAEPRQAHSGGGGDIGGPDLGDLVTGRGLDRREVWQVNTVGGIAAVIGCARAPAEPVVTGPLQRRGCAT